MDKLFNIGDKIYGFCNGYFGRDDYDDKICVMVTNKYAIFQYINGQYEGYVVTLNHSDGLNNKTVTEWKQNPYTL